MKSLEALYHLRHVVTFSAFFLMSLGSFGQNSIDSLLRVLDNAINNRELYLNAREKDIANSKTSDHHYGPSAKYTPATPGLPTATSRS